MIEKIDIETLRKDLIDYYGTAMFTVSPLAMIEVTTVESASDEELIQIARNNNIDLSKYIYIEENRKENIYVRK